MQLWMRWKKSQPIFSLSDSEFVRICSTLFFSFPVPLLAAYADSLLEKCERFIWYAHKMEFFKWYATAARHEIGFNWNDT